MQNENQNVPLLALKNKPQGEGWIYDTYYECWYKLPTDEQLQEEAQQFVICLLVCLFFVCGYWISN